MQLGLKLGSKDINYTEDIYSLFDGEYFQYIELLAIPNSFGGTIQYWKQFSIPIIIHAPHSFAGMNLSLRKNREENLKILHETFSFADELKAEYIIFHSGVNGSIEETFYQIRPFIDSRCLIENKPFIGLNDEKCLGAAPEDVSFILNELKTGFCFDLGHAICTANSLKKEPLEYITQFIQFSPRMYHLSDGNYTSEYDTHFHYGKGTYPLNELLKIIPDNSKVTNEARHDSDNDLGDFKIDSTYFSKIAIESI